MTKLDQVPESDDSIHLLLLADSRVGKTTYAAQAAIDGYRLIYVDSDNGLRNLKKALKNHPEAMKRIYYFRTDEPYTFLDRLFNASVFRWNLTKDTEYTSFQAKTEDEIVEIVPARIPPAMILSVDSWTAVALDAMEMGAKKNSVKLIDMIEQSQSVYGDANLKLKVLCAILQHAKFHCIVQGHHTTFELWDKPLNRTGKEMKQKEMILREVMEVPLSSSRPHGREMVKYFNEVGWAYLDRKDERRLDFRVKYGRVGGGTPDTEGPINTLSFAKAFGPPQDYPEDDSGWIRYYTGEELAAKTAAKKAGAGGNKLSTTPAKASVEKMKVTGAPTTET